MSKKVRHVLGISGGKDSAALAIYLHNNYPHLDIEYYTTDTGKELDETYALIDRLEGHLGKKIIRLTAVNNNQNPFDHFYHIYGGYLPSSNARWCTKKLKLEPFEEFVGDDPVVSYVGIRGDEDREGYISKKPNIQSIFPFRKNIWSEDVIGKALKNENIPALLEIYRFQQTNKINKRVEDVIQQHVSPKFTIQQKLNLLLDLGIKEFNHVIFEFLNTTSYPLAKEQNFALLDNEEVLVREDIFKLLRNSGVGVPAYYEKIGFEVEGKKGEYARSRSGCYFCFFQQKIEWIWLYEQHPERFAQAVEYEKEGYTWNQEESLQNLIQPERIKQIKEDFIKKTENTTTQSPFLLDILDEEENIGCATCFI